MKDNVINLFGNDNIEAYEGANYSSYLSDFIKPFENDFPEEFDMEDVFNFAMNAWNFGNMNSLVPEDEFQKIISTSSMNHPDSSMLKNMIDLKISEFKEHDRFIVDFEIKEAGEGFTLTVMTEVKEAYLENMMNDMVHQPMRDDFEEGYINRCAIVLNPQQPFYDWINQLTPNDPLHEIDEANIYLVDEEIDDLEQWLRIKYDKFFVMELDEWHTNKKEWPQKRSYKMFKQWFKVGISSMIYDLEKTPIYKES